MPDPLFTGLLRETEGLNWASPADVVRRGRQRRRRQLMATTAATAMLVLGVAGGVLAAEDRQGMPTPPAATPSATPATAEPSEEAIPTPPPSPTPRAGTPTRGGSPTTNGSPTGRPAERTGRDIPAAAMLRPADLGAGFRAVVPEFAGDGRLAAVATSCKTQPTGGPASLASRRQHFAKGQISSVQVVERYSTANARAYLRYLRTWPPACEPHRPTDTIVVTDTGHGDESLHVRFTTEGGGGAWVVVRQGDLVAEVSLPGGGDPAEADRVAAAVADRLCAGTAAC
ncbi:MAG TPA: hypothetical protein VES42_03495 [Pilimelia sp.]|nr:hypothetical protein [Pilimelia sp.]